MPDALSTFLLHQIQWLDDDSELSDQEKLESQESQRFAEAATKMLLESRLSPTNRVAARRLNRLLKPAPGVIDHWLDDHYTRHLLKDVQKFVRRTMKLDPLVVQRIPSNEVGLYVWEATRSYVFGFWHSCIALSRTALETSLRECVQESNVNPPRDLRDLIQTAGTLKLLDGQCHQLAREVQRHGNSIIHAAPSNAQPNEKTAFDTLSALRGVLLHLYKDFPG